MVEALKTKEVVTPVAEVIVTGESEKVVVASAELLLVAIMLTEPVNPLNGVTVKVTPEAVAFGATLTDPVQGVMEKSAVVVETTSTEASVPSPARSVPFEPT